MRSRASAGRSMAGTVAGVDTLTRAAPAAMRSSTGASVRNTVDELNGRPAGSAAASAPGCVAGARLVGPKASIRSMSAELRAAIRLNSSA
jgi:hypothetical protein